MEYWGLSIFMYIILIGMLTLVLFQHHYLMMLLSIEIVMISFISLQMLMFSMFKSSVDMLMLFMVFIVCESTFGISILLYYSVKSSSDLMLISNL